MDSPPASHFGYSTQQTPATKLPLPAGGENFIVEELLDFSNDDECVANDATTLDNFASNSTDDSNVVTPVDSCNSSLSGNNDVNFPVAVDVGSQFTGDLCVPYDDIAELEWLSNFVEESFSSEDLHKIQLISGMTSAMKGQPAGQAPEPIRYYQADPPRPANGSGPMFSPEMSVPGKARSKRSRATPTKWASRLLGLSSSDRSESQEPDSLVQPGPGAMVAIKPMKATSKRKFSGGGSGSSGSSGSGSGSDLPNGEVRRCLHCATDKTPQWRTGPLGSKTLCNACGVRYKSGRLVPEYRPASSPTFMLTKHSNSHRKVMELRRQKELQRQQQLQQQQQYQQQLFHHPTTNNIMFDPTNTDDYLIHQHIGPDFRQII